MSGSKDPNDIQYDVTPVNVGDVPPPPSYEEVMGQFVTSVQHGQTSMPSLAYIDIMPRILDPGNIKKSMKPTFQSFEELVVGANMWLRDNRVLAVWKCETVERKVSSGQVPGSIFIDLENMMHHQATFGFNCFVFGLRLWLTPKTSNQSGDQEIGLMNIFPIEKEISVVAHQSLHGWGRVGSKFQFWGMDTSASHIKTMFTYEGLKKSLDEFNKQVKENPIPGSILNIESTTLTFSEGQVQPTIQEAASSSMWFELDGQSSKRYTEILRVFYVKGNPTTSEICMKEFIPSPRSRPTNAFEPVYFETFPAVIGEAAAWIQQQAGIQIANIETRFADVRRLHNNIEIDTDSTDHFDFGSDIAYKLRFLRIFYVSNSTVPSFQHSSMSSRLFVPIHIGGKRYETMTQTMTRIDQWMKATGLPIFGVESVTFLKGDISGRAQDRCEFNIKPLLAKYWVNAIRVYFPTAFLEPPFPNPFPPQSQLSIVPVQATSPTCNIL